MMNSNVLPMPIITKQLNKGSEIPISKIIHINVHDPRLRGLLSLTHETDHVFFLSHFGETVTKCCFAIQAEM